MIDEQQALMVIEESRNVVLSQCHEIAVIDETSQRQAATLLGMVQDGIKHIETERKTWTQPLLDQKKRLDDIFKRMSQPLEDAKSKLQSQLIGYQVKLEAIRQKEEARLRALAEKRRERAEAQGKPSPIPETIIPYVQGADKTVYSDNGSLTYTTKLKGRVVDLSKIPLYFNDVQLLQPDMVAINKLVSAGIKNIPGIEIYEETFTRVR